MFNFIAQYFTLYMIERKVAFLVRKEHNRTIMSKLKVTDLCIHITIRSFYCFDYLRFMFKTLSLSFQVHFFSIKAIMKPQFKSGIIATQHSYSHFKPNNSVQIGFFVSFLYFSMRQSKAFQT